MNGHELCAFGMVVCFLFGVLIVVGLVHYANPKEKQHGNPPAV